MNKPVSITPALGLELASGPASGPAARVNRASPSPALKAPGTSRADFPGLSGNWHYLDTAATAQKPQAVIDATLRAMGEDYATVHRGVYQRSADMTRAYEEARQRTARFIGAKENEIVFVRGATEGLNLIANAWGKTHIQRGDRILLSQLEHHANIVPWQMLAEKVGAHIDICPLTKDGKIDLDKAEDILSPAHKLVAFAHVSNVLGSRLEARRAAAIAHKVGAKLLLDGCQAVPHMSLDMVALDCDFYVFSAHKLYGPTGIGVAWVRSEILETLPPWQGGGAMIDRVTFDKTSYASAPQRFEAGTPSIIEAIGLHAAIDYVEQIGMDAIHKHETALVAELREALTRRNSITVYGPADGAGIVSFTMTGVHPHDIGTILDENGVAIRAGHHCAQPLMDYLGITATARASFGLYSNSDDIAALIEGLARVERIFR